MAKSKAGITINVKDKKLAKSIQKSLNDFIKDKMLGKIANKVINMIRDERSPAGGGFKELEDVTVDWRLRMEQYNPTHDEYFAGRSNLTFSGEFIDSIKAKIVKKDNSVFIAPTGKHPGYFGANGIPTRKGQPRNIDIAKGQKEMGRNILEMTKTLKKEIIREVKKEFKKQYG